MNFAVVKLIQGFVLVLNIIEGLLSTLTHFDPGASVLRSPTLTSQTCSPQPTHQACACTKTPECVRRHPRVYEDTRADSGNVVVGQRRPFGLKTKTLISHSRKTVLLLTENYGNVIASMFQSIIHGGLSRTRYEFLLASTVTIRSSQQLSVCYHNNSKYICSNH